MKTLKQHHRIFAISILVFWAIVACPNFAIVNAADTMVLRYSETTPPTGTRPGAVIWWKSEVEKQTAGRVKIEMYWAQSLLKPKEHLRGVGQGVADLAWVSPGYFPSDLPLGTFFSALDPFFNLPLEKTADALWNAYDNIPILVSELERNKLKLISIYTYLPYDMWLNKKIASIADIKGLKVRVASEAHGKVIRAAGGTPIWTSASDLFTSLQKGTMDAILYHFEAITRQKLHEVAKYWVPLRLHAPVFGMTAMNLDKWEKLPTDIQQILARTGRELTYHYIRLMGDQILAMRREVLDAGVEIIELPKWEMNKWANMEEIKEITMDWIKDMDKKDLPAKEVLDKFLDYLK